MRKGRVAQAGPGAPHRMIGTRATHALQFVPLVKSGKPFTTDLVETKGAPFVAGPVVARKENEGILEVSALFKLSERIFPIPWST